MKMIAHLVFILLGILCIMSSGCGLIPIPYTRMLPEAITSIEIRDSHTNNRLLTAEVHCFATRHENWTNNFPPHISEDGMISEESIQVPTVKQSDGTFILERTRRTAYLKPYGITPLGRMIVDDYFFTITAHAEGYSPLSIRYYPGNIPSRQHVWENGMKTELEAGYFRMYLRSEGDSQHNNIP